MPRMTQDTPQPVVVVGRNGAGITSLVLGLVAFTFSLFAFSALVLVIAVIGLAFGIAAAVDFKGKLRPGKGVWIPGLVLNALVILLIALILYS